MTGATIRRTLVTCALAFGLALVAVPASAQSGQVKGKVVDANNAPVEGAKISIVNTEMSGRKLETKTNKKGEYIQIGLQPGKYTITAEKEGLSSTHDVQIHLDMAEVNFTLAPGQGGGAGGQMTKEEAAKQQAKVAGIRKAFDDAIALSNEGKNEEAIAKFNEVAGMRGCAAAIEQAVVVARHGNASASSDVQVAVELLRAGVVGARANVDINLASVKDAEFVQRVRHEVEDLDRGSAHEAAALGSDPKTQG